MNISREIKRCQGYFLKIASGTRLRVTRVSIFLAIRLVGNAAILGQPRFQFLAIKVVRYAAILGQSDTFERKCIDFLY